MTSIVNNIGTGKATAEESVCDMCRMQCFVFYQKSYEDGIQQFSYDGILFGILQTNFSICAFLAAGDLTDELLDP